MVSRRRLLATLAATGTAATAGCLDGILGGDGGGSRFSASPATVADATLDRTGYAFEGTTTDEREREFGAGAAVRTVRVLNYQSRYVRSVKIPGLGKAPVALFVAVTSPQVTVLGERFNPLDDLSTADILERVRSQYRFLDVGDVTATTSVDVLGGIREFTLYEGRASVLDVGLDITIHVAKFRHGGDFLVLLAVYPRQLFWESGRVRRLARGVEH